jgi:hypothetical protein
MSKYNRIRPQQNKLLTKLVNVGVVDLSSEKNFRGNHGVLVGKEKFAIEHATLVGGLWGSGNLHEEMSVVGWGGLNVNSND